VTLHIVVTDTKMNRALILFIPLILLIIYELLQAVKDKNLSVEIREHDHVLSDSRSIISFEKETDKVVLEFF